MAGLILGGDVYLDRFTALGAKTGRIHLGNCTEFNITEPVELKERISRQRDSYGAALDAVYIKQPSQFSVTFDDLNLRTLAIALLGDSLVVNQDAGTITDEPAIVYLGAWTGLLAEQISSVSVTNVDKDVTYVLGTDYILNLELGMIQAVAGGALTNGANVLVNYTKIAVEKNRIRGGTVPSVRGEIFLSDRNLVNGQRIMMTAPSATMAPTGALSLINAGGDFGSFSADGRLNLDTTLGAAYALDLVG